MENNEDQELIDALKPVVGSRILCVCLGITDARLLNDVELDDYQRQVAKAIKIGYASISAEQYHGDKESTANIYRSLLLSPNMSRGTGEQSAVEFFHDKAGSPMDFLGMINGYLNGGYI